MWELNNILLTSGSKKKSQEKLEHISRHKNKSTKMGCCESSAKRKYIAVNTFKDLIPTI